MNPLYLVIIALVTLITLALAFLVLRKPIGLRRIGDYLLLEIIGKGGMATIYKAKNRVLSQIMAVKVMDLALMNDPDLVIKFIKEGESVAAINARFPDAPVVRVAEYGADRDLTDGLFFIAMEYVRGTNLLEILRHGKPLDLKRKVWILHEVGRALLASHQLSIFHRDITPDNVIVADDRVTLIDFGIAKQEFSDYRTLDGSIAGKPYYMSPEQCAGKPANDKSDIYSLGIILYSLLQGSHPFDAKNPIEIMRMHQSSIPPPLRDRVPAPIEALLFGMLSKDPDSRPSAARVVDVSAACLRSAI